MSNSLLRDRDAFLKRAAAVPVVEKRSEAKRARLSAPAKKPAVRKDATKNFHLIAKIVNHMKSKHLTGDAYPLTLHEMLEECAQNQTVTTGTRASLDDALRNNPKMKVIDGEPVKFAFKPPIDGIKDKKSFIRYMEKYSNQGLGGQMKDDILESLPKAEKILKYHEEKNNIYIHHRPDKKHIIFFKDNKFNIEMDEQFQKLWRSVPVESVDEDKIAEYLGKQGITYADDPGVRKVASVGLKRRKPSKKRPRKTDNTHLDPNKLIHYDT